MKTLLLSVLPLLFSGFSFANNSNYEPPVLNIGKPTTLEPSPAPSKQEIDQYYSSITATSGNALLGQVRDLTVSKHTYYTVYENMGKEMYYKLTDYDPNDHSKVYDFYTLQPRNAEWASSAHWSREHVWCAHLSNGVWDRQGDKTNWSEYYGGADMHHLRPTDKSINSSRQDSPYGDLTGYAFKVLEKPVCEDPTLYKYGERYNGIFEPNDDIKGDAARIIMYQFIHYNDLASLKKNSPITSPTPVGNPNISVDNGKGKAGDLPITNIIKNPGDPANTTPEYAFEILLKWNKLDPVSNIEMNRNNGAYSIQGNRNPFIDHPEYANAIWGNETLNPNINPDPKPDVTLTSIKIDKLPNNTNVPYYGTLDTTGLKITATYSDKSISDITNQATLSTINNKKIGPQEVTVTYQDKTTSFDIFVTNEGAINEGEPTTTTTYTSGSPNSKTWSKSNPIGTLNNVNWTIEGTVSNPNLDWYFNGKQIGKADNAFLNMTLSTNAFANKTITNIKVTTAGASNNDNKLSITVGGKAFGQPVNIGTNKTAVHQFSGNAKGDIVLNYNQTTEKAIYLTNIEITYADSVSPAFTPLDQLKAYSTYFLETTAKYCQGANSSYDSFKGIITNGEWNKLKEEYLAMPLETRNLIKTSEDVTVKAAFERYSYIVNKYSQVENFINVTNNNLNSTANIIDEKSYILLAMFVITIFSVSLIYIIKKRHQENLD